MSPSWDDMHAQLAARREATGTLKVRKHDDAELHSWVMAQKETLVKHFRDKPTALSAERVAKLKALGYAPARPGIPKLKPTGIVDSVAAEAKWDAMVEALAAHMARNGGSAAFLGKKSDERALMYWTSEQRREYKRLRDGEPSSLTARRMQRLAQIGFDPEPVRKTLPWEEQMAALLKFKEEHGHCRPPTKHPDVGMIVQNIRNKWKARLRGEKNGLTDERVVSANKRERFVLMISNPSRFVSTSKHIFH